jgi:hypothetical protein
VWYQSLTLFVYCRQRKQEEKENTLIHISLVSEAACRDRQKETEYWNSVEIVAGVQQSKDSQEDCKGEAGSSQLQSDSSSFPEGKTRVGKMATEGHARDGKKIHQQQSKDAMDKELTEIRARMEILALQMQ